MNRKIKMFALLSATMLALALLPASSFAQATNTETVTMQVDVTLPSGTHVVGTVVAKRTIINPSETDTELTFNGTINGYPASATATAVERWSDDGHATIEITKITSWKARDVDQPPPMDLVIAQAGPGLITVNGVPVAMDGQLQAPG